MQDSGETTQLTTGNAGFDAFFEGMGNFMTNLSQRIDALTDLMESFMAQQGYYNQ